MFNEAYAGTIPLQGTAVAAQWDNLYLFLVWLSVFFFILVIGAMLYFAWAYRAQPGLRPKYLTGNHFLEAIWIIIPTVLLMIIFAWGWYVYVNMVKAPTDAYEIRVIGRQWSWAFQYDFGKSTAGELYVPLNKPVKLVMTSQDVLHSFFIPNFRIKQDVVPGMYTSVWFEATVPGRHQVFCAEYCGLSHSGMLAQVIALDNEQWAAFKAGKEIPNLPPATDNAPASQPQAGGPEITPLAAKGKQLAASKGCVACHSADGKTGVGPSWKGIWGKDEELTDGSKVKVDENYIRESIESPQAKLVKPFGPVMPTFKGLLTTEEINAVIEYIKSLK